LNNFLQTFIIYWKISKTISLDDGRFDSFRTSDDDWYDKGRTFLDLGNYSEALECCDKALEINPNHAAACVVKE
jgi:tetratricopeptide (TPR) repeat protein